MANTEITEILNTVAGENGAGQTLDWAEGRVGREAQVQGEIASGDTVVVQGRITESLSWVTLATFTAKDIKSIALPGFYRAIRTVDGAAGDSTVTVEIF